MPDILARQIRSARAWLNWSREDLASRAGVVVNTIAAIEKDDGASEPNARTMAKIMQALDLGGVAFTQNGLQEKEDVTTVIEGDGWYLRLLDDVLATLKDQKNSELLFICADDSVSPPEVNERLRAIRAGGTRMRQLVEEGNTYLMGDVSEYRYMPKERFY
ncbi:MAG TPA: helix-turn-helix transcriptional regulator, partial [Alphaproteobacteria bacterium]